MRGLLVFLAALLVTPPVSAQLTPSITIPVGLVDGPVVILPFTGGSETRMEFLMDATAMEALSASETLVTWLDVSCDGTFVCGGSCTPLTAPLAADPTTFASHYAVAVTTGGPRPVQKTTGILAMVPTELIHPACTKDSVKVWRGGLATSSEIMTSGTLQGR